jgi:hypothetical protein
MRELLLFCPKDEMCQEEIPNRQVVAMEWIAPGIVLCAVLAIWAIVSGLQDRVMRLEAKLNLLLQHFKIDVTRGLQLSDRVKELARDPYKKIEAIKVYREETGANLVEAKDAVEAYINSL